MVNLATLSFRISRFIIYNRYICIYLLPDLKHWFLFVPMDVGGWINLNLLGLPEQMPLLNPVLSSERLWWLDLPQCSDSLMIFKKCGVKPSREGRNTTSCKPMLSSLTINSRNCLSKVENLLEMHKFFQN